MFVFLRSEFPVVFKCSLLCPLSPHMISDQLNQEDVRGGEPQLSRAFLDRCVFLKDEGIFREDYQSDYIWLNV